MGFLLQVVLASVALGAAEAGQGFAALPWGWALGTLALPHLTSLAFGALQRGGRFRLSGLLARFSSLSAPAAYAFWVLGTDWLDAVRGWTGARLTVDTWPEFALFLAFAPYPLLQALAIHADCVRDAPRGALRRRTMGFQLRMFASVLAPLAIYVFVTAQIGVFDALRAQVQEVGLVNALFLVALLGFLTLVLPAVLTSAWDTVSMPPGPQREMLDVVARRANFRPRDVRIWRTGFLMANAAIVGMGDRRVVLFSDSLLASLHPRELAAVYGHEIGHAKRRHVGIFLVWTLTFFLGADWLATSFAPENEWLAAGIVAAVLLGWILAFGWLSRRCELEADLYSLELLGDPEGMTLALERVGGRINDVAGWRHFSSRDRVAFLWRAWSDREFAARFHRRLRRLTALGVVLFVLVTGAQLWNLIQAYPEDQVRAALALGHWNRALERARSLEELDPEDLGLLQRGAALQGERPELSVEELEGGLQACLTEGAPWQRCAEYAGLLELAGRSEIGPLREALEAARDGDPARARELAQEVPSRWARLLIEAFEKHLRGES